jgi:hypothetical protein
MDESNLFKSVTIKHLLKAEIITNTLFLSLNLILILLLFFILRTTVKKIIFLKYRLIILCIIKATMRIIYIKYYYVEKKLLKEILLSIMNTFQIYLIIMLIESILVDVDSINNNQNKNGKYNKKISYYFSISFLIINLPYERFSSFKTFIYILQNICLFVYSLVFYKYVDKKINLIISKLIDGNLLKTTDIYIRLLDVRIPILILFLLIFIIDIFFGLLGNSILILYSKLVKIALKESANVFIFLIFYSLIYLLEKKNQKKLLFHILLQ